MKNSQTENKESAWLINNSGVSQAVMLGNRIFKMSAGQKARVPKIQALTARYNRLAVELKD